MFECYVRITLKNYVRITLESCLRLSLVNYVIKPCKWEQKDT